MRRNDIVTGILLILSIIHLVLAAPVSVQEKHQAHADVVHMSKDLKTVLGKRWEEELEKLGEDYFETSGKSIDSSGSHSPSSPLAAPDSASSTSNPDQLMEQSCSPSSSSMQGLSARGWWKNIGKNCLSVLEAMSQYDAPRPGPMLNTPTHVQNLPAVEEPPSIELVENSNFEGQASGYGSGPPPTEFYSTTVEPSPSPDAGSTEPEHEVVVESSTGSDSALHSHHQSLSAGAQPADLQAALDAVKGKAKEERGISRTSMDVANASQRDSESEPAERPLDPGE